jgi:hypothetical protein
MAITVKHSKVSTIPDDADTSLVRPSDWNADHTLTGTIEIANGGTGQTTANAAFNALVPSQTGNTGKYLTTDGTDTSWAIVSGGSGTVTSVAATAGTGISITGSPITTSGTLNITNTAPDQVVAIASGTGISTSGTYPNFTVTNTAPDQTVAIASGTGITVSGTYPNFTVTNSSPSLGGDVVGPASATDNAITRFNLTTGKLIQNSLVIIDDSGNVTGVNTLTATNLTVNDDATLGGSNADTLAVNSRITTDLEPNANNAKDIGTSGRNWRDGFFGRTVHTVNLELTGTTSFDGAQGTAGQVLTSAGTGNTPTWTTPTTGTVTSVTGSAPVVSSGGATPAISMAAATGSVDGYLTSTDWTTFNNKGSGTVTSVGGTGTVSGISLSGTVTTTGTLTLGGTLDLSSPPVIGNTTAAAITGTTITATAYVGVSGGTF